MKPGRLWCFLNVYFDLNYRYLHRVILLCLLSSVKPGWFVLREARHTKSFKESCGLFSNPPRPFCSNLNEGVRLKEIKKKKNNGKNVGCFCVTPPRLAFKTTDYIPSMHFKTGRDLFPFCAVRVS